MEWRCRPSGFRERLCVGRRVDEKPSALTHSRRSSGHRDQSLRGLFSRLRGAMAETRSSQTVRGLILGVAMSAHLRTDQLQRRLCKTDRIYLNLRTRPSSQHRPSSLDDWKNLKGSSDPSKRCSARAQSSSSLADNLPRSARPCSSSCADCGHGAGNFPCAQAHNEL